MQGRVLIVAGSDSGGGAGIQADIKTVTMLGGYAMTAITAITAQNTQGVFDIIGMPAEFVKKQIEVVLSDIGADVIKTGMLYSWEIAQILSDIADLNPSISLVVDPVMVATSGDSLLEGSKVIEVTKQKLIPKANIVTPNIPEAEILIGRQINNLEDMKFAAKAILQMGAKSVLVKGGHAKGDVIYDVFFSQCGEEYVFSNERIYTKNTHGTGCTLASAIACGIAKGKTVKSSIAEAKEYLQQAILASDGFGKGQGAVKHNFTLVL